jgi:imidazolonepropionase-like amidohydrolase
MIAVIETAHKLYKKCCAHVYAAPSIIKLVNMGIDELEHCSMITEEAARLMEDKGVSLIPTFCPYDEIVRLNEENLSKKPLEFQQKLRRYAPRLIEGREIIINSKIKLGYGTDLVSVHRSYEGGYEYESWMLSGIAPLRILRAATATNAEILGLSDKIGTIEPGKCADISAWNRDLMTDPKALLDCAFVMKDGKVYETEKIE